MNFDHSKGHRLVFIPRVENNRISKVLDASQVESEVARQKTERKLPPIVCMYKPWHNSAAKLVIYFHGVGEDVSNVMKETFVMNSALKVNVLAVEFPGYGLSWNEGICTEKRMTEDAKRVLNFIIDNTRLKMSDIIIYGRSLGTFLATTLAKEC